MSIVERLKALQEDEGQVVGNIPALAVEEIERLDHALRRIAQYEGFEPAKDHDHCCLIARHALYPE